VNTNDIVLMNETTKMQKKREIPYTQEIFRKSIHLTSLSIPIIYAFIPRETAVLILTLLFLPTLFLDIARHYSPAIRQFITTFFGQMMREHELDERKILLSGATYVLMSALLCVLVFPKIIAITAFAIMIVSDICSALIGRKFGTIPFLDKSLQGTAAFWVSAWCVIGVIWATTNALWHYALIASIASVVGGIVEAASIRLRMDDNLSIPLSIGASMWLMLFLLESPVRAALLGIV
jgi:dolichol kinase